MRTAISLGPGIVANAWILGELDFGASLFEGLGHDAGAGDRNDLVGIAMENPEGNLGHLGSCFGIASSANRYSCSEEIGTMRDGAEGSKAAHGEPGDVNAVGVDLVFLGQLVYDFEDHAEHVGGLFAQGAVLGIFKISTEVGPPGAAVALRGYDDGALLVGLKPLKEIFYAMDELRFVIVSPLAGSVEEEDESRLFGVAGFSPTIGE